MRLLRPLASDLKLWRKASGNPPDGELVITDPAGGPWADYDWDEWRDSTFPLGGRGRAAAGW